MSTNTPSLENNALKKFLWAAPVAAAGLAGTQEAQAQVVVFTVNLSVSYSAGYSRTLYNLNTTTGFSSTSAGGPLMQFSMAPAVPGKKPELPGLPEQSAMNVSNSGTQFIVSTVPSTNYVAKLSAGSTIGSGGTFATYSRVMDSGTNGQWEGSDGTLAYIGISVPAVGGGFNYGWLSVSYNDTANTMTLNEIAFQQTAGLSITAGEIAAIPEPATNALLLAAGAAGMAAYRRRKAKAALAA